MEEQQKRRSSKREELIKAGIKEINRHGISGFSIRRVAAVCNVSCAAPAKHFGDKNGFLASIIEYVNELWGEEQRSIAEANKGSLRRQIVEISVAYIKFLVENPHFRSILMLKDDKFDNTYKNRGGLSSLTRQLVDEYCRSVNMDEETKTRKLYIVRSLIYGAALMFDNKEMEYNEHMLQIARENIDREFALP